MADRPALVYAGVAALENGRAAALENGRAAAHADPVEVTVHFPADRENRELTTDGSAKML